MKLKFVWICQLLLSVLFCKADTLYVSSHTNVDMVWHESYDRMVYFPTEDVQYRKVLMYYTLGCASTGCSDWDYDVLTYLMHRTGDKDSTVSALDTVSTNPLVVDTSWSVFDVIEPFELGRFITPYGSYMNHRNQAYGTAGYDSSWEHTFVYDVTDYASLLKDSVTIRSKYNGWSSGFDATITFAFIEGEPQRDLVELQNIYRQGGGYQNSAQFESNVTPAVKVAIPKGARQAQLKVIVSGHGANSGTGCGEFCDKDYYVKVNGDQVSSYRMWRDDCGSVAVSPQGGTWIFPRGNWCPGDKVHEQRFELTPYLSGDSMTVDIDIEPYTLIGNGGASHSITTQLFFYGEDHFEFDAELHDIVAPNNFSDHSRWNPTCGNPIVVIKNNADRPLDYCKIEYGAVGGLSSTFEWNGHLEFEQKDTVYLPAPRWTGVDAGENRFYAQIHTPNHRYQDEQLDNDRFEVALDLVPRWEAFRLLFRTNGVPEENLLQITNEKGEVVFERKDLSPNTLYSDELNLPNGCYQLLLTDEGGDGLDFWYYGAINPPYNQGRFGYVRIFKQGGGLYANFGGDFGAEIRHSFIVGQMDIPEAPTIDQTQIMIFPNPSSGEAFVSLPEVEDEVLIELIDASGRQVLRWKGIPADRSYWYPLDLRGLENGIYIVNVRIGTNRHSERIVISN